jgi:hypothetical protein
VWCVQRHRFTMTTEHLPSASGRKEPGRRAPVA